MGANEGALVAGDAVFRIPDRNAVGNRAFLTEGDVLVHRAISKFVLEEGRGREFIAIEAIDDGNIFVIIGVARIFDDFLGIEFDPFGVNRDLMEALGTGFDGFVVVLNDVHTLLFIGLLGEFLHPFFRLFIRHDGGRKLEEGRL